MSTRVLILGGGFAGVSAYQRLAREKGTHSDIALTLVNRSDSFVFVTLAHEVATGSLMPSALTQSLRLLPNTPHTCVREGEVREVDMDKQIARVLLPHESEEEQEGKQVAYSYDILVLALGSVAHFFDIPGAEKYSIPLKTLADGKRIKNHILDQFRIAESIPDEDEAEIRAHLCFTLVGGGPTGVELAGDLADYINHELTRAFPTVAHHARIMLVHAGTRFVDILPHWFDEQIQKILTKKGCVEMRLNTSVTRVDADAVHLAGERVPTYTTLWTAGVKANTLPLTATHALKREENTERIIVRPTLQVPHYDNVFVVGDGASVIDSETGVAYPMRAQFATRQGAHVATNILKLIKRGEDGATNVHEPLAPFVWRDKGIILSLGKGGALAQIGGVCFSGFFAWWLYRTAYLLKLIGVRAKIRTALDWTLNLFFPRDVSKV